MVAKWGCQYRGTVLKINEIIDFSENQGKDLQELNIIEKMNY